MKTLQHLAFAAAALFAALLAAPTGAAAGVVTIHPDQLIPDASATIVHQSPGSLSGTGDYYRVVKLPVGKRVTKLVVTYSSAGGFGFTARLFRKRVGELNDTVIDFTVDSPGPEGPVSAASNAANLDGPALITAGNRWFVILRPSSVNGQIHDLRVFYR